jgi:hypothetical protein
MTTRDHDENLLVVVAVEQYAHHYGLSGAATLARFRRHGITDLIRANYNTLHTQDLAESFHFADDILQRELA